MNQRPACGSRYPGAVGVACVQGQGFCASVAVEVRGWSRAKARPAGAGEWVRHKDASLISTYVDFVLAEDELHDERQESYREHRKDGARSHALPQRDSFVPARRGLTCAYAVDLAPSLSPLLVGIGTRPLS